MNSFQGSKPVANHAIATERPLPQVDLKGHTIEELAAVANVSVEAIKKAISLRQKQLIAEQEAELKRQMEEERQRQENEIANQLAMYQYQQQQFLATSTVSTTLKTTTTPTTTTTRATTTTTRRPVTTPKAVVAGGQKVCATRIFLLNDFKNASSIRR